MGKGFLTVQATTAGEALPVANAHVEILNSESGEVMFDTYTDANGCTDYFPLEAPDVSLTLDPNYNQPAYSVCDVKVEAEGFKDEFVHGVEIVDTQNSILPVHMLPLVDDGTLNQEHHTELSTIGLLIPTAYQKTGESDFSINSNLVIPDYITVHLGAPNNTSARNVRVPFSEYIKNVTSSEIYSTWPTSSLIANIHAIVTFALNRVFTEWYPSRGFNFDITSSTAYDQHFRDGGVIFENISQIVDGIFNVYARRVGFANPFFTQFCNGSTVTCPGLSQWGTVTLANRGLDPLQILHYYYPDDLELATSNNVTGIVASYPNRLLSMGTSGDDVKRMQNFLNRIRVNFPLIPPITNPDGNFGIETQNAVRVFQETFHLTPDGVIGRSTWNKITFIHVGVIRLAELDSEGIRVTIGQNPPNVVLRQGSRGGDVMELQFILNTISSYYNTIPPVVKDSVFGALTENAVMQFQRTFDLTPDGIVGPSTWNKLYEVYRGIDDNVTVPQEPTPPFDPNLPFPGTLLKVGSSSNDVRTMQTFLNTIRIVYSSIPYLVVDGIFGEGTRKSVVAFQQEFALSPDGVIGQITWDKIVQMYNIVTGNTEVPQSFQGDLSIGSRGIEVRLIQQLLADLHASYPSLPQVTVDGIFGPNTEAAVRAFQTFFGENPTGIVDERTWYAIINQSNSSR